jgi:hypothetical protein
MDRAIWGVPRWGFFRWGVTVEKFDVALEQLKNVSLRGGGLDPNVEGTAREGYARFQVYLPLFEDAKVKLGKV